MTWIFCAGILWVTFRAGWTAKSSNESVQNIQPFIPGEKRTKKSTGMATESLRLKWKTPNPPATSCCSRIAFH